MGIQESALSTHDANQHSATATSGFEPDAIGQSNYQQTVQASIEGWSAFIRAGLSTEFYLSARERVGSNRAARATLMHLYLSTFGPVERRELETNVDSFLHYATGFLRELQLPGPTDPAERAAFHRMSRRTFAATMREILKSADPETRRDALAFMRTMRVLCSSIEGMVDAWDEYKEYCYRFHAQFA